MTKPDSTFSLYRAAKAFSGGTFLSRLSGMTRDVVMSFVFGTTPEVAAFLLAFRLAHLFRRIFGEGALHSAFIPLFEERRQQSTHDAYQFFLQTKGGLSLILTILILGIMSFLGLSLCFFSLNAGNQQITWLTLLMMPSLLFICLFGLNAAFLNCEKHFFISGVAPVFFNLVWIIAALCLHSLPSDRAMTYLSLSVIGGCFAQWFMTVPSMRGLFKKQSLGLSLKQLFPNFLNLKIFLRPLFFGIIGTAASQINNTLDVLFARYADAEGPAYLWYAIRLQQLPLALFGISLSGALLPPLTRAVRENQIQRFFELLRFSLEKALILMIPLSFALLALAPSGINLLYGRGHFTEHSAYETTLCLWGYGLGLVPMALVLLVAAVFYAQKNFHIPMFSSILSMGLNLILNTILVVFVKWGATSVAITTSVSAWVNLFYLIYALPKETIHHSLKPLLFPAAKLTAASLLALANTYFMSVSLTEGFLLFSRSFFVQCGLFFGQVSCFLLSFIIFAWLFKVYENQSKLSETVN